jgi:hypothetical protein
MLEASREVDIEINAEENKCMIMSHHQNARQSNRLKVFELSRRLNLM